MTTSSPTGDRRVDALLPLAARLIGAVHDDDALGVRDAFAGAADLLGDPLAAARSLAVLLAAMCDDDAAPTELLAWHRNPTEYHRLREAGVDCRTAAVLAANRADTETLQGKRTA